MEEKAIITLTDETVAEKIARLKTEVGATIVAHYYQQDAVFAIADFTGDSLELAKKAMSDPNPNLIFCGVGFMGQSAKILAPHKRVMMPKIACCAMARMIDKSYFDESVAALEARGISKERIYPVTYINSSAEVKAEVGKMGGMVCTSSNAHKIIATALESGKKVLFVPDRCLGLNIAKKMGLKGTVIGIDPDFETGDIICYDGFCSVHQLFEPADIAFYREKYPDIQIVVHPECDPEVVALADFVGSTSQMLKYIGGLDPEQKVAVGTEYNLVHRMREKNTYVLSSTKPECPTMNETTPEDVLRVLESIKAGTYENEIVLDEETAKWARVALERMMELS